MLGHEKNFVRTIFLHFWVVVNSNLSIATLPQFVIRCFNIAIGLFY